MGLDVLMLSRIQFAMTIMFHYLFPPLSIGLGVLLVAFEALYHRTGDADYRDLARFWTRVFAVNFAVGVATGVVMEFQFGTNWGRFSKFAGDVFGSALAAEGIFAFFLESGFLAVLVFGWDRVSPRMHLFATTMVALGATFSAIWIIVANSWMNTPAGHRVVVRNGVTRAEVVDFWAMIFNPSSTHRVIHVLLGAYLMGAFFVLSVSAWHVLKGNHKRASSKAFRVALVMAALAVGAIFLSGDAQARKVSKTQPAKLAAYEGHFRSSPGGTPMTLIGWPNTREGRLDYKIAVPGMLSMLVSGDPNKPVTALDQFPERDRPPVVVPFLAYHAMVYTWGAMASLVALGLWGWWRGILFDRRWLMWPFVLGVIAPVIANQAGWVASEVGRQPWVVQGLQRTSEAHSHRMPPHHVIASIAMFATVYVLLGIVWLRLIDRLVRQGPEPTPLPALWTDPNALPDAAARRTGGSSVGEEVVAGDRP